ncbi:hypothetical protein DL96DRAFT_1572064 [Flagelloscypha sp. PMI_526]|nr:hypothetical protein DL96DRAFT_1572064 [Flagelloscypha sp. PMI_526]
MPAEPSAQKRKQHTKSRAGCKNCKTRRVKCDEVHPICKACSRRKEECLWDESDPRNDPFAKFLTAAASHALAIPPERQLSIAPCTDFKVRDLELIHNWTTRTIMSIMPDAPVARTAFTVLAPQLAFQHDPLLHAMFALSALQLHTSQPEGDHLWYAKTHCQKAILGLKKQESSLPMEVNFVTNIILANYWLCSPSWTEGDSSATPSIFDWFPTARRFLLNLAPLWDGIFGGAIKESPFLPRSVICAAHTASVPTPFPASLLCIHLKEVCPYDLEELEDADVVHAYEHSLMGLRGSWNLMNHEYAGIASMYLFPATCEDKFCEQLSKKKPRALVILAHFCALISQYDGTWWYGVDRSKNDIQRILSLLDDKWLPWLEFPMRVLKLKSGIQDGFVLPSESGVSDIPPLDKSPPCLSPSGELDMSMSWMTLPSQTEFSDAWLEPQATFTPQELQLDVTEAEGALLML